MSYNSKYTGKEVEDLLDKVNNIDDNASLTEEDIINMGFTKNEGTITEVKMNGVSKGTSGVVDLGTVITEHQDISGKQDVITDLELIREGASLGATALQEVPSGYAKTEDIPTKVSQLENDVPYALKSDVEFEGNVENGVYIMTASGSIVAPTITDNTALGVVLITDNQRIIIPKADATDGTNTTLYWGKNLRGKDVAGITEATDKSVAKTDFNGKANTDAIIAAYGQHSVYMDSRDMCKVLASYTEGDFTDWYVPALGQLYEIYNNKADINTALQNIGGTAFESSGYWSSSENNANYAWLVYFDNGIVSYSDKNSYPRVRFVRNIPATISLKDKVFKLEADKVDKEALADVAISGSYNDLKDKPAIPTKVSELENDTNYIAEDVVENGVYAVDANGKLIDYTIADNTAIGIVIVAGKNQFMVSTKNIHYGSYSFWGKGISGKDISNITDYATFNGISESGSISKYDDFTAWTDGVLSDFNGKSNTSAIIEAYQEYEVSMDYYDMCNALNSYNTKNEFNDWYIPSLGQLALIYVNINEINEALTNIGGTVISNYNHWSSSEYNSTRGWMLQTTNGKITNNSKSDVGCYLRCIRDISAVSSLKDKVSNLENSKQDLLVSGTNIKTINGQSILGSGDITIEGGGGGSLEDNRYFTDFTVEAVISHCETFTRISYDASSLVDAAKNQKIICVPYQDYSNGFAIAQYKGDDSFITFTMQVDGTIYMFYSHEFTDEKIYLTGSGFNTLSTKIESASVRDGEAYIEVFDNIVYTCSEDIAYLSCGIADEIAVGSTIRFRTSNDFTLEMYDVLWANGVIPTIEPNTFYELSITSNFIGQILAVLTPFKQVES